jgi:hypothetical protein
MGIFKGIKPEERKQAVEREPGTYEFHLMGVEAGLLSSSYSDEPKPALRFVFEDDEGRLSALVNIPKVARLADGSYGLSWNEKSKFWHVVGALWGRGVGESEAPLLDMDIPGVESEEDLHKLPLFFVQGVEPVKGVTIRMGEDEVTATGRPILLTITTKKREDGTSRAVITGFAPIPRKKAKKADGELW